MKRFRFRLDQVLHVRRVQEDRARFDLLSANREAHLAGARVEERLADYAGRAMPQGPQSHAEFERAVIRERTSAGLAAARAEAASAAGARSSIRPNAVKSLKASSPAARPAPRWRGSIMSARRPCHGSSLNTGWSVHISMAI